MCECAIIFAAPVSTRGVYAHHERESTCRLRSLPVGPDSHAQQHNIILETLVKSTVRLLLSEAISAAAKSSIGHTIKQVKRRYKGCLAPGVCISSK
eukprot:scaffold31394_cov33-Attheya_sp.AAC.1